MLLDDEALTQQFATITRVAELLEQVIITAAAHTEAVFGGNASVTGSSAFAAAGLPRLKSVSGVRESSPSPASPTPPARAASSLRGRDARQTVLQKPLPLSRGNPEETAQALRQLGGILGEAARDLHTRVDARLVEFYTHLHRKAEDVLPTELGLHDRPDSGRTPPRERAALQPLSRPTSQQQSARQRLGTGFPTRASDEAASGTASLRASFVDAEDGVSSGHSGAGMRRSVTVVGTSADAAAERVHNDGGHVSTLNSSSYRPSALTLSPASAAAPAGLPRGLRSRNTSSLALHNAPMARRLEEERAAASELQSFLALLLESAVDLSGATAAAIYLSSAPASAHGATLTNASFHAFGPPSGGGAAASGGGSSSAAGRAQFLHCVAHCHNPFPSTISCTTTNVLTTVALTGVAANVQYSESSLLRLGTSGNADPGVLTSTRPSMVPGVAVVSRDRDRKTSPGAAGRSLFDMYNGVIVPLKGVGCLVLANKCKSAASDTTVPRFSVFDEHVAWSAALLSEAVLHRYDRQLLLRASWAPSCVNALKPYVQVQSTLLRAPAAQPPASRERKGGLPRQGSRRYFAAASSGTAGGTVKGLGRATAMAAMPSASAVENAAVSSLVFDPQNDIFSKTMTMVRTGDPQVVKALPQELRSSSSVPSSRRVTATMVGALTNAAAAATSNANATNKLNDEEVFQAAAQYITNLESLWRRTITESNTMYAMVENYNKTIRRQGETIALLESKVRELTTHVAQLERRNNNYPRANAAASA